MTVAPPGDEFWTGVTFVISGVDTSAHTFDWSATRGSEPLGVSGVIVKGHDGGNVYAYEPAVSAATGLHGPSKDKGGYQSIARITFCLDVGKKPPPTTTVTETVTVTTPAQTVTTPAQTVTTPAQTVTAPAQTVTTTTPGQAVAAPPKVTGTTPSRMDVTPRTPRRGSATARIRPGCLRTRSLRVDVRGSAMRRVTFRLNGRQVKRVTVKRGQRLVRRTLRTSGGRVQRVTAIVQFTGGRTSRTLRVTGFRCVQRNTPPRFTG